MQILFMGNDKTCQIKEDFRGKKECRKVPFMENISLKTAKALAVKTQYRSFL